MLLNPWGNVESKVVQFHHKTVAYYTVYAIVPWSNFMGCIFRIWWYYWEEVCCRSSMDRCANWYHPALTWQTAVLDCGCGSVPIIIKTAHWMVNVWLYEPPFDEEIVYLPITQINKHNNKRKQYGFMYTEILSYWMCRKDWLISLNENWHISISITSDYTLRRFFNGIPSPRYLNSVRSISIDNHLGIEDVEIRYLSDTEWPALFRHPNSIVFTSLPYRLLYRHDIILPVSKRYQNGIVMSDLPI